MRSLFWWLLAANLALAGYLVLGPSGGGGEPELLQQQLHPERIRILPVS
ncbi:hypothetical protein [Pelomicrobium sp. G1]